MRTDVRIYRMMLLSTAMLLATIALGWWGVLFVAVAFAVIDRQWSVAAESGLAAALAWLLLFIANALLPGAGIVGQVGRAMSIPAPVLPLLTLLFPGVLAWSGATLAIALARAMGRPRVDLVGSIAMPLPDSTLAGKP